MLGAYAVDESDGSGDEVAGLPLDVAVGVAPPLQADRTAVAEIRAASEIGVRAASVIMTPPSRWC
jgi:hypothetical protein